MLKILQAHLLRAFVANSKIDAIYALYPESFCDKNLAVRKVFAFSDSVFEFGAFKRKKTISSFVNRKNQVLLSDFQAFWKRKYLKHPQWEYNSAL